MAFESDLILCKLAIDQKFLTEREFYECLKAYQAQKQQKALLDILLEKDVLARTQIPFLLKMKEEQNYQALVSGYQILSLLGIGGMGCVYRAIQTSMEREVALKVLPLALAKDEDFIARFRTEAKLTGRLNHVNLIAGYDVGEHRGIYFFAMELVNGISLDQYLKQNKKALDEEKAIDFILQIARALECAYEYHIVHRDIKPENILIT
ncbi:MAG: serine/threonine-protein kinase, partial [Planctomycetota bacterium]